MDYSKHYQRLIDRAKHRVVVSYTETHHIVPRCLGGSDDAENLVALTPEEHYVAHQLLVKIYPNHCGLVHAANMMVRNRPSNKLYGWLKRKFSIAMSERQQGSGNTQYGTMWIHNETLRVSQKISAADPIPNDWKIGRVLDWDCYFNKLKKKQNYVEKRRKANLKRIRAKHTSIRKSEPYRRARAKKLYSKFVTSGMSLTKFAIENGIVPMTLSKWFNEFISEYNLVPRISASTQMRSLG